MEEWLRCNMCYQPWKDSSRIFSLTQCQHIFCSQCMVAVKERCPKCKSIDIATMILQKPLQQSLSPYFRSLSQHMQQADPAADLQRSQALIFLHRYRELEKKYEWLKEAYNKSLCQKKQLIIACKELKESIENRYRRLAMDQSRERATISANIAASNKFTNSSSCNDRCEQKLQTPNNRVANEDPRSYRYIGESVRPLPCNNFSQLRSARSNNRERENVQRATEQGILSRRPDYRWTMVKNSNGGENRSDLQPYAQNAVTFAPHLYQPRAILSDDSAESPITPANQRIRERIPRSLNSSSNASSSDDNMNTPNYACNRRYNYPSNF